MDVSSVADDSGWMRCRNLALLCGLAIEKGMVHCGRLFDDRTRAPQHESALVLRCRPFRDLHVSTHRNAAVVGKCLGLWKLVTRALWRKRDVARRGRMRFGIH